MNRNWNRLNDEAVEDLRVALMCGESDMWDRDEVTDQIQTYLEGCMYLLVNPVDQLTLIFPELSWSYLELTDDHSVEEKEALLATEIEKSDFFWQAGHAGCTDDWIFAKLKGGGEKGSALCGTRRLREKLPLSTAERKIAQFIGLAEVVFEEALKPKPDV